MKERKNKRNREKQRRKEGKKDGRKDRRKKDRKQDRKAEILTIFNGLILRVSNLSMTYCPETAHLRGQHF